MKVGLLDIEFNIYYSHNKTGNVYRACSIKPTNCTNKEANTEMILYTDGDKLFVRERNEFMEKFTYISED